MGRNIETPEQVRSLLVEALSATAPGFPPPILGVDQEGGRVARFKSPVVRLPPARSFGRKDDETLTRRAYEVLGAQLRAVGFSVDFAPVLDIDGGPDKEVIGDRSFGGEADVVRRHGVAAVTGLLEAGICPCGKHFPGHGMTTCDSHAALPIVDRDIQTLNTRELIPFAAAIESGLPLIMPAHIVYRGVDEKKPATISKKILGDVLRRALGFEGAIITDDLKMGAVNEAGGAVEVAVDALMAGADLLLCCHDEELQEEIREALVDAARRSPSVERRLVNAASRSISLRRRFVPAPASVEDLHDLFEDTETRELMRRMESDFE